MRTLTLLSAFLLFVSPAFSQGPKGAVDSGLRWLRYQQKPGGEWGSSAQDTAKVLYAFASSHRSYRADDGPWLSKGVAFLERTRSEDGSFGVEGEDRKAATLVAHLALRSLQADLGEANLERTCAYLTDACGEAIAPSANQKTLEAFVRAHFGSNFPPAAPDAEAAPNLIEQLLGQQGRRGDFGDGNVVLTAERVALIAAAAKALPKSSHPPIDLAEPTPVKEVDLRVMRHRAVEFLLNPEQRVQGMWGFAGFPELGISSMVIGALQTIPKAERTETLENEIRDGLAKIASFQQEDGSIHQGQVVAYTTSVAILALARSEDPAHREVVTKARKFLEALQSDEGEGYAPEHKYYGGIGYGGDERPDLSNLQIAMDALHEAGVHEGSETYAKALIFLQRCQNRSESNPIDIKTEAARFVAGNDGGGTYMPGDSPAGYVELGDGTRVARSYGSMSYALLKGFLFAGLPKDDPRVKAVFDWVSKHYTVKDNPGFEASPDPTAGRSGYFYYLYTMARTLDLYGTGRVVDGDGRAHDWRAEIAARLASMQRPEGSWVNEASERWWEGNAVLATAYGLLTLTHCDAQ